MPLLTAVIVKNSHLIFLKKHPRPNLKGFQYQILTLVKRLGKELSSKKNFSAFLLISCSDHRLKLCQRP